ncbi:MAG: tetratricopeptide repeat protein [Acidimicrobiales bacterium]
MFRRFAIATVVIAAIFGLVGRITSPKSPIEAPVAAVAADQGSIGTAADLSPVHGLKPWPEIIDFWQSRVDANPVDYPSRTELGLALNVGGSEQGDLDLYRQAETVFAEAIDLNPNYAKAHLGLASSLIAQHRFQEAIDQIELVVTDRAESPPTLALLGDANLGYGNYDQAAAAYERLVRLERSAPTVSRLARLRSEQGRSREAVELATEALALSEELSLRPNSQAFYHFQLGHFLFLDGNASASTSAPDTASDTASNDAYRRALEIDPDHGGAAEGLAFSLAASGDLAAAADVYHSLIEQSPAADLHGLYADVLRQLGQPEQAAAQEKLGRAAAIDSFDDPAERRHLVGYHLTRNPEIAVALARADLEQRHDSGAYDALAWALYHVDQFEEASQMIDAALASGNRNPATLYHAAAINFALAAGDQTAKDETAAKDAAEYLDQALAINPNFHPTEAADAQALAREVDQKLAS